MKIFMNSLREPHIKLYLGYTVEESEEGLCKFTIGTEGPETVKKVISLLPAIQTFTLAGTQAPTYGALITIVGYPPGLVHFQIPKDEEFINYFSTNLSEKCFSDPKTVPQLNAFFQLIYGLFYSESMEIMEAKKRFLKDILALKDMEKELEPYYLRFAHPAIQETPMNEKDIEEGGLPPIVLEGSDKVH